MRKQVEFRDNARECDAKKMREQRLTAQRSYGQLLSYCGFDPNDKDWELTMAQEPMPRR